MRSFFMAILCVSLVSLNVWAEETLPAEEPPGVPIGSTTLETIGVGTEGYGSPIRSDTIMTGEIVSPKSGKMGCCIRRTGCR